MADFQNKHSNFIVLNIADQAIVTHPVAPQAALFAMERLAPTAGIFGRDQPLTEESLN